MGAVSSGCPRHSERGEMAVEDEPRAAPRIFLSYRRDDAAAYAGRLHDYLVGRFGKNNVFIDIESIEPGVDFAEALEKTLTKCDAILVVIGRSWLSAADRNGGRRIENPNDFVRFEIERALALGTRRVIPVLVGGARVPEVDELPESLAGLTRRQAFELSDQRWSFDVRVLSDKIDSAVLDQATELNKIVEQTQAFGVAKLPSGTATFLFSDIEGSTALLGRIGEESYTQVLADHHYLLRSALSAHEGTEVDTQEDRFFAVFSSSRACAAAVIEMQRSLASREWPDPEQFRVRMGIHAGEAQQRAGGLDGLDMNKAARLAAAAHGGQVLLSEAAAALFRDFLPDGTSLRDLGLHRLKDLGRPEQIFQLDIKGLTDDFPPIRSLDNPELENNLPAQLSSFVGREIELSEIGGLVETSRLVTLTGPGGSGKTRLALQVAAELLDGSGEGVWFVELADVSDPDLVGSAVSRTLGIKEQPGHDVTESLLEALTDLHLLIVLDNCEHMITSCAKLADAIVRRCPRVHLLATSREPLGIDGETVWPVAPLSLPPDAPEELAKVASSGAVALFLDRARSQMPGFSLSEENAPVISSVCRRLDGMPLAIELAVARLRSLSLADLNNRLDRRFQLLTGGSRSALPRHQTLRGVVDWSYDLLTEPEQVLLRRLSVFSGGFELDAAEEVCGFGAIEGFDVDGSPRRTGR